jgi:hypothetical protein
VSVKDEGPQLATGFVAGGTGIGLICPETTVLVLSHVPLSMETKKSVVEVIHGVVYVLFTSPEMGSPPDDTLYHRYWPSVPPDAVSMREEGPQPAVFVVAGGAGIRLICPVATVLALSHVPSLTATKKSVVEVISGVVYELFTSPAMAEPPVDTSYHRYWPFVPPDAVSVRDEGPQLAAFVVTGAIGSWSICAATMVLAVSPQVPSSIATKKSVLAERIGVLYVLFTSPGIADPPEETVYHRYCPLDVPEAVSNNEEGPHADEPDVTGGDAALPIWAMTAVRWLSQLSSAGS